MNEKKNIDKLFKEQFKNFDVEPKDSVWDNIYKELHEKKRKRRVIPIWWKYAGVAAALVLLFTIANTFFDESPEGNSIPDIIVNDTKTIESSESDNQDKNTYKSSEEIIKGEQVDQIVNENDIKTKADDKTKTSTNKNESKVVNSATKNILVSESVRQEELVRNNTQNKKDAIVSNTNTNLSKRHLDRTNKLSKNEKQNSTTVTNNTNITTTTSESEALLSTKKEKEAIDALIKSSKTETDNAVTQTSTNEESQIQSDTQNTTTSEDLEKEKNAIEEAIAEAENEVEEETDKKLNRWSISPNVAPVYFSSLGNGSALDNQFVDNNKEGEINMSYGINGSYAINEKIKVRAGINKVQLGYKTNNVLLLGNANSLSRNSARIANVNTGGNNTSSPNVFSAETFQFGTAPATLFTKEQASLDQQLGFIEIPIELEYNLINKKIGINLIGGFSTLFLSDNEVFAVRDNGERTRLGEATNIKDMSYSANFGIGLDYNFSNQFQFNLEPTFKYQINTFDNTSGDFQPFFIGIYTGLSFKF
ncbi:hypothetical protein [uncultured Psychroserpens sp.]|uniref:hypothetical protein n=1 Tax=uncultured Psychroserpens sp. TaxID=255436 RepID=UPI00261A0439|nr:hypothetical protein [uncultured Psychroserpens sp.]